MSRKLTPAQQQYMDLKKQNNDCLLFFRLGDFYELFYEDAQIAHKVLGITLTARHKDSVNPIPMAGIPYHALSKYLPRLVKAGYKVAIAEQVSKPVPGKVVDRKVMQIVTPGTYIGDDSDANRVAAISSAHTSLRKYYTLAWGDFSLGIYWTQEFDGIEELYKRLAGLEPSEIILDIDLDVKKDVEQRADQVLSCVISVSSVPHDAETLLCQLLSTSGLEGFGEALHSRVQGVFSLLLSYVQYTQQIEIVHIHRLSSAQSHGKVGLDHITKKNLELFSSSYEGSRQQSLIGVIDTTQTSMGSRCLHEWISNPTNDIETLLSRQDAIGYYLRHSDVTQGVSHVLKHVPDVPRLLNMILRKTPSAVRVHNMRMLLERLLLSDAPDGVSLIVSELSERGGLSEILLTDLTGLAKFLVTMMKEDQVSDEGGYIREGVDTSIDELRQIVYHSDELLIAYQQYLVAESGITKIKVKFVKNQGYVVEITPKDIEQFESHVDMSNEKYDAVRRQTLKSGQRYMTTYLNGLQGKILEAEYELKKKEQEILASLVSRIQSCATALYVLAESLAQIDVWSSHATWSQLHNWCCPSLSNEGSLSVREGRHPVVEKYLDRTTQFIPNDLVQSSTDYMHLITGPNMGGKSTFLRQNALIILLAHAGLYVPAREATVPLVDGIYARVGSGDALAKNQSTFMTEMIEMSNILHNASSRSFVVLDELGRGTSTYDGLALAKAIVINLCEQVGCKTLFATHYHELVTLQGSVKGLSNRSVSVYETDQDVIFLKKIVKGGANKSYGLDVAKLAGVPSDVIDQARGYLSELEKKKVVQTGFFDAQTSQMKSPNEEYVTQKHERLRKRIDSLDISQLTPVQALVELERLQRDE